MKIVMVKTIILVVLFLSLIPGSYGQTTTLYNTKIVDVENGKIIPGMTVYVKDGMISKIAKAKKKIKKNQKDCTGTYLMPGLIDSHTHWSIYASTPKSLREMANSYIADGVTTVRDAGGDIRYAKCYEAKLDSGLIVGPTVYASSFWAGPTYYGGRMREDTQGYKTENAPWSQEITDTISEEHLEKIIIEAKEYGCTGLKLYNDISYEMLVKIVALCHKHGVKPWGHFAVFPATAMDVVKAGVETVSHTYLIDGKQGFTSAFKAKRF